MIFRYRQFFYKTNFRGDADRTLALPFSKILDKPNNGLIFPHTAY